MSIKDKVILFAGSILAIGLVVSRVLLAKGKKYMLALDTTDMKPSDFILFPKNSLVQKTEAEYVARNIMIILARTGNVFRPLEWKEYKKERTKDGWRPESWEIDGEQGWFDMVIAHRINLSEDAAKAFSYEWRCNKTPDIPVHITKGY